MRKLSLITTILLLPFIIQAQDISLSENYKSRKQKRLQSFKSYQAGDLNVSAGFSSVSNGLGLLYNFTTEYMLNDKLGIRGSFSSNNLSGGLRIWGIHRYSIDVTYHFIQKKRWDVYAFAGMGLQRYRYKPSNWDNPISYGNGSLNAGVGARYKIKPKFGLQLELGRISSFGIYKGFNLKRK